MSEGAKQRSVVVGEDGVERVDEREEDGGRELCCGGEKKEQRGGEKDRMCWRKTRWKNTGGDEWKFSTFNLKKLCDANCTSGRASSRFSAD